MIYLIIALQLIFNLYIMKQLKTLSKLLDIIYIKTENLKAFVTRKKQPYDTLKKINEFLKK